MEEVKKQNKRIRMLAGVVFLLCIVVGLMVHPVQSQAATIKLNTTSRSLVVNDTYKLKVKNTSKKIMWKSSKKTVAKVSSKGKVTALKSGTTTITAKVLMKTARQKVNKKVVYKKVYKTLSAKITVKKPSLNVTTAILMQGQTYQMKVSNTFKSTKWSGSKKSVVTVSQTGKITVKGAGTAKIKVLVDGVYTCSCEITVPSVAKSDILVMSVGEKKSLSSYTTFKGASGTATFTSKDKTVAKMSKKTCTAVGAGQTYILIKRGKSVRTIRIVVSEKGKWIAHRGYSDVAPENTLEAFIYAAAAGAWGIETDVRNTADGELVLMHDSTIDRMTSGTGAISSKSIKVLRPDLYPQEEVPESPVITPDETVLNTTEAADDVVPTDLVKEEIYIDAGNNSGQYEQGALVIPTLEEYLEVCRRSGSYAVIELKGFTSGTYEDGTAFTAQDMYQKVYETIIQYGMQNQCWIISTQNKNLEAFRKCTGTYVAKIPMQYVVSGVDQTVIDIAKQIGNCGLNFQYSYISSPEDTIALLRKNKISVMVRGLSTYSKQKKWYRLGADYISANGIPVYD